MSYIHIVSTENML